MPGIRCGPFERGLMRLPASRSIGRDSSAIVGIALRSTMAIVVREGLRIAVGTGGASIIWTMGSGGSRYFGLSAPFCAASRETAAMTNAKSTAGRNERIFGSLGRK